jgi:3-deoxy-D-arabino-heptulosonate 7-phosphate (DAHP) synthase
MTRARRLLTRARKILSNFNEFLFFTNLVVIIYYIVKQPTQLPWLVDPTRIKNINEIVLPKFNFVLFIANIIMGAMILIFDFIIKKTQNKKTNI